MARKQIYGERAPYAAARAVADLLAVKGELKPILLAGAYLFGGGQRAWGIISAGGRVTVILYNLGQAYVSNAYWGAIELDLKPHGGPGCGRWWRYCRPKGIKGARAPWARRRTEERGGLL